jgi:hypothetical protein
MKQSEKIIGPNKYDIRYKSLLIWAKYLLGKVDHNSKTLEIMQSRQEDNVLMVLLAILTKLKEVNVMINSATMNTQDLQTAIHLCLGKVRSYKHEFEKVGGDDLEFEDEVEPSPYDVEVHDDDQDNDNYYEEGGGEDEDEFEGFNLSSRKKFVAFLTTYFAPLKNELSIDIMEEAIYKIINSKMPASLKQQNLNFFQSGFKIPLSLE